VIRGTSPSPDAYPNFYLLPKPTTSKINKKINSLACPLNSISQKNAYNITSSFRVDSNKNYISMELLQNSHTLKKFQKNTI